MIDFKLRLDNRGQVGIGTLIVFIAMVLVAAIAAGVLVNTADMLQESAEQTGEDSQAQVSDRLRVVDAYGEVDTLYKRGSTQVNAGDPEHLLADDDGAGKATVDNPVVHKLGFLVMQASGANDINLETVTVSWQGPNGAEQTTIGENAVTTSEIDASDHFTTKSVTNGDDSLLESSSDRILITVQLGALYTADNADATAGTTDNTNLDYLNEGDEVTIKFNTEAGATVTKKIKVPSLIQDDETIEL